MIRIILGVVLMGIAFVLLFMFIQGPEDNSFVAQVQTSLHCHKGEEFVQVLGPYVDNFGTDNDGQSVAFYCENVEGQRRDVTINAVFTLIGGFAIPFVVGLLMMMWGIFAMVWKAVRGATNAATSAFGSAGFVQMGQPSTYYNNPTGQPSKSYDPTTGQPIVTSSTTFTTLNGQPFNAANIPPEKLEKLREVFNTFGMPMPPMTGGQITGADLVTHLKQLEDARTQNLITQEEYDRLRKDILDKMA